jgi:[ribosomal protein S5]-alanine N-acetyltransferase
MIPLPIETERLQIRRFVPAEDSEAMAVVYCDPEVMRFVPTGPLPDIDAVRAGLEQYERAQQERGFSVWGIVERESGRLVGDVGFGVFQATGDTELGYTLARDRWGLGYATEAADACLHAGLEHLGTRIIAVVDAENAASLRVPIRIGMERVETIEAFGRPHVLFAARYPETTQTT